MKKILSLTLTAALAVAVTACKNDGGTAAGSTDAKNADTTAVAGTAGTEAAEREALTADVGKTVTIDDMRNIVKRAKAEGSGWSVEQWKDAMRDMVIGLRPMYLALHEFQVKSQGEAFKKELEKDPKKAMEVVKELQASLDKYKPCEDVLKEFEKVVSSSPNGKTATEDTVWHKQMLKELGLPEDI